MRIIIKRKESRAMTLQNGEIGKYYQVTGLEMEGNLLQRLQALGLTVGTKIKVQN
ncbi:MAG: FeoA domain-containing protein, partial [Acetivibrio ethanolgignens]